MRAALAAHRLSAEQQRFVAPAVESLPLGDADPDRLSVAILVGKEPVGMFALDRGGYFREFDSDPQAVLLRAFYVAPERQRRGYARAGVAAVPTSSDISCPTSAGWSSPSTTRTRRRSGPIWPGGSPTLERTTWAASQARSVCSS